MENVFVYGGWKVRLDAGLPIKQAMILPKLCEEMTAKMIAKEEGVSPVTITKRIERAKFSLGMQRSVRGLCLEAMKRGIISPLILALCAVMVGNTAQPMNPVRRPPVERRMAQFRVMRKVDEALVIG